MGAGASAGSISQDGNHYPPTWKELLLDMVELVEVYHRDYAIKLIDKEQYLDAAQVIFDKSNSADRTRFLRETFDAPKYQASAIHKLIYNLDPKIVITTNYDQIYEDYCRQGQGVQGFNVSRYYEGHVLNDIRSDIRCILKAHGCMSDPTRIVMTRSSYFEARRNHLSFYAVLDALFLTNTLLFIGAGLSDPDIQLILENANLSTPSDNHHYALVPDGRHRSIVSAIKNTSNIVLLEYEDGHHEKAEEALEVLRERVESHRAL
jgi:hypothetical protein